MATFITGSHVKPFSKLSQDPITLLESISSAELALCVPYVKLWQIDPITRQQVGESISMTLVKPPTFGSSVKFLERPSVSLESVTISTKQNYGISFFSNVTLTFVVHNPDVVFNSQNNPWRSLLIEGNSHILEYGWTGNTKNDLFNGIGYFDKISGLVVPSIKFMLINVVKYTFSIEPNGEMKFNIEAIENSELGLRGVQLGETSDSPSEATVNSERSKEARLQKKDFPNQEADKKKRETLSSILNSLNKKQIPQFGNYYKFIDIANGVLANRIETVCKKMGYSSVSLFIGNFNSQAGFTSDAYGKEEMSSRSIGDFLIPVKQLNALLGRLHKTGQSITFHNFISSIVNLINGTPWRESIDAKTRVVPNVTIKTYTKKEQDGTLRFVYHILDANDGTHPFDGSDFLDSNDQSRERVLQKVKDKNVPIVRFAHAKSYIESSTFQNIADEMMRPIFIEKQFPDRKTRVQVTDAPDVANRAGQSRAEAIVPLSVAEAELEMIGNFVFDNFAILWLDIFNIGQLSGTYIVKDKTDTITPGSFKTRVSLISEGNDPLNTRKRLSSDDLKKIEEAKLKQKRSAGKKKK